MSEEKRRQKRHSLTGTALVKIKNKQDAPIHEALVANISKIGVGLYSDAPIEKDTPISIKISFISSSGHFESDYIEGSIISSNKVGPIYFLGIVFDEALNKEKQPLLYEHFWNTMRLD